MFSTPSRCDNVPRVSLPKPLASAMPPTAAVAAVAAKWKLLEYATMLLTPARPALETRMKETIRIHICPVLSASLTVLLCSDGRAIAVVFGTQPGGFQPEGGSFI